MITVLGASGFIGSNLVDILTKKGYEYYAPKRNEDLVGKDLGKVIYCIGLTADFRVKPYETVDAHICYLSKILKDTNFESLTYLSSSRLYLNSIERQVSEDSDIKISINNPDELYTLTKLTGERICLSSGRNVKIVRLSNVYGEDFNSSNFIFDLLNKIKKTSKVELFTTLQSAKDYISIESVTSLVLNISMSKHSGIFNVANGENLSNDELLSLIRNFFEFECTVNSNAEQVIHPLISINKIEKLFFYDKENTKQKLFNLIKNFKNDTNR
jgi:nucleoside-diphosphate-sugar epimerase